ncbi:hypothetical protein N499_0829 [Wolbachia pipientis wVitA]|nr:hypothetical protein N499_0829 [Wolbachia pipientis wVitA]
MLLGIVVHTKMFYYIDLIIIDLLTSLIDNYHPNLIKFLKYQI